MNKLTNYIQAFVNAAFETFRIAVEETRAVAAKAYMILSIQEDSYAEDHPTAQTNALATLSTIPASKITDAWKLNNWEEAGSEPWSAGKDEDTWERIFLRHAYLDALFHGTTNPDPNDSFDLARGFPSNVSWPVSDAVEARLNEIGRRRGWASKVVDGVIVFDEDSGDGAERHWVPLPDGGAAYASCSGRTYMKISQAGEIWWEHYEAPCSGYNNQSPHESGHCGPEDPLPDWV